MFALRPVPALLKEGDVIAIKATVRRDSAEAVYVDIEGRYGTTMISPGAVLGFLHAHFEVDDVVICDDLDGTIRAIHGGNAWVLQEHGFVTAPLADLQHKPTTVEPPMVDLIPVAAPPEVL